MSSQKKDKKKGKKVKPTAVQKAKVAKAEANLTTVKKENASRLAKAKAKVAKAEAKLAEAQGKEVSTK